MSESFRNMEKVPGDLLQTRLTSVKELPAGEYESYEIMKDTETGDHYLHYAYLHRDVASGGAEEQYHQLLPIGSDDVLGIMFSDQGYRYPEDWQAAFLRNGPSGYYVWYDPGNANELEQDERLGREIAEKLQQLKSSGKFDEESVRQFLKELEKE